MGRSRTGSHLSDAERGMELVIESRTEWPGRRRAAQMDRPERIIHGSGDANSRRRARRDARSKRSGAENRRPAPPLWHWLYLSAIDRASELGTDGHATRGGFLPPVPLPRRMFAGGRYRFERPLRIGDTITRRSRVTDVALKNGRTGPLVFVVVRHEISNSHGLAVIEEHEIVYRDKAQPNAAPLDTAAPPGAPAPPVWQASQEPTWRQEVLVDDVTLFRYSALTFNGHRIHYDRRYADKVEGYPASSSMGRSSPRCCSSCCDGISPAQR